MTFIEELSSTLARGLFLYFRFVEKFLRTTIRIRGGPEGIEIGLEVPGEQTIDERIAKIDAARTNLMDGLKAIDELRSAAEENKRELKMALDRLEQIQSEKQSAEVELEQIRDIASADADTLRKIVGVPSKADVWRQQIVGFVGGVVASLIAAGVIWLGGIFI